MKLSIIISVLNSHEIVRRQLLHFKRMALPGDVEIILLDDGSFPALTDTVGVPNLTIQPTGNHHASGSVSGWTVELARNQGARMAKGEYLLMTDIDYVIPREAIETVYTLKEDKAGFHREFGVLDENGNLTQDFAELRRYGLLESRIKARGTHLPPHPNNFIMRKSTFWQLGGYREDLAGKPYPNKGDTYFKRAWAKACEAGEATIQDANLRATLYMFPNGQFCGDVDYNPFGLFHDLSRKSEANHWYLKQRDNACLPS
jgi:glycosyltransferase involved in cell wall biosynthesis